jgi:hypothetical protein
MRKFRISALVVGLAVLLCSRGLARAQQTSGEGVPAHLVVTVEPHKGAKETNVTKDDVMVFEGQDRDKVIDWVPAQGDHAALELFVLIDDESNMTLGTQLDDIRKFMMSQPESTKVGLAYMQNGTAQIVQAPTTDHAAVAKSLRLPLGYRGANASPYFSVSDLVKKWPQSTARREIVMISDGIDPFYLQPDFLDPYLDAAIDDAVRAGILISAIYTPGVGHFSHSYWLTYWGQLYLAELSEKTGGEGYYIGFTGPPVAFAPYLGEIEQRLNHQYLLAFLAKRPKKAGFAQIRLASEIHDVDLVSAKRVWVTP